MFGGIFSASTPPVQTSTPDEIEQQEPPRGFLCPISLELMTDPVLVTTGHTFERQSIETWFATGHITNPVTGLPLPNRNLVPNFALAEAIASYRASRSTTDIQADEDVSVHQSLLEASVEFLQTLEAHITANADRSELNLDPVAAKSYVATVFALIRKRNLGLLLLPNTEETCCIPSSLSRFLASFVMSHGELMLAQQHAEFCKASIEVPLNKGEDLQGLDSLQFGTSTP